MKLKQALGVYDHELNNYAKIDPTVKHDMGVMSTVWHETTHMHLTQRTDYALLVNLLLKLARYHNKFRKPAYFLQEQMLETQECVAVFIEMIYHLINNGKEYCLSEVEKLKRGNPKYYNYFQPLQFLIEDYDYIEPIQKGRLAFFLGCLALSVDVKEFNKNLLKNKNFLKRRFEATSNSVLKVHPDRRFKKLIKVTEEILKDKDNEGFNLDCILEEILEESKIPVMEEDITYVLKHMRTILPDENHEKMLEILDGVISLPYSGDETMTLRVHPAPLKAFESKRVENKELLERIEKGIGVLTLIFSPDIDECPLLFMDLTKKTNFGSIIKKQELLETLSNCSQPLVLRISDYKKLKNDEDNYLMNNLKRCIYIYLDSPYIVSRDKINDLLIDGSVCKVLDYETFQLLVIKIDPNENVFVLQPLMNYQLEYVLNEIKIGKLKVKLNDNAENTNIVYDDIIFKSDEDIIPFDTIVNAMMQVGGKVDMDEIQETYIQAISK
ncbi:hypothetical protein ACFWJC_00945 [Bacillus wiedmannii]|uniref:hypothetical protein n=1 Tax=Bacillus wiedmannii TaxID=1890302 RepID=UPI0036679467